MHRAPLLKLLATHVPFDQIEAQMLGRMQYFVETQPQCFERSLLEGHVTGSAWVISDSGDEVLLLHHRKLDRWLQPGGHCDGDPDVLRVAMREAQEESGILALRPQSSALFDIDVHWIPERGEIPGHWHYDARFLLRAAPNVVLLPNSESKGACWMPLRKAILLPEASLQRMAQKSAHLLNLIRRT